jgi:hypothetical protein
MNVTNAVLPHMRLRRDGTIVVIGSRSAFRSQMAVRTFLHCTPRFVSESGDHVGLGYAPRLGAYARTRTDLYPYVQPPTVHRKQPSTVRDTPWLVLVEGIDPSLRSQRTERRSLPSSNSLTCA